LSRLEVPSKFSSRLAVDATPDCCAAGSPTTRFGATARVNDREPLDRSGWTARCAVALCDCTGATTPCAVTGYAADGVVVAALTVLCEPVTIVDTSATAYTTV